MDGINQKPLQRPQSCYAQRHHTIIFLFFISVLRYFYHSKPTFEILKGWAKKCGLLANKDKCLEKLNIPFRWLVVLGLNATLTAKVISWRSVTHMCFLALSHQY